MIQRLFRILNRFVFRTMTKLTIDGVERAAQVKGSVVAVSNHLGFLDGFLIYHATWREDVIVIIAEHWREHAWSRLLARAMDAIFVDRYNADIHAVREVMRRLDRGGMLVLAPEGTRSPTGALIQARHGAAYIAMKAGLPLIPAALTGTEDKNVFACWKRLRRPEITLTLGEPFHPPPLPKKGRDEAVVRFTEEIMLRIAAILPEKYRGVYADHPDLEKYL